MQKLPARAYKIVMPGLLTLIMTGVVSAVATIRAAGPNATIGLWFGSWMFSWAVAFPTVLVILPLINKFLRLFIEE